ncbi:hypothetical protein ACLGI4_04055 [Streptomyces sp. HMX112]|uniref:hypothetical protein n=1 Tax=Streptomyces sp. HMX112 TaxID=3390850 RepID=UPI003A806E99
MSPALLNGLARTTEPRIALRRFLALDALVTAANGLAYAAASGPLGRLLGVDPALLLGVGVFLTLFAAGVGHLASRREPPAAAVGLVVGANAAWAALSVAAPFTWLTSTIAGASWIPAQAAVVAGFAGLQWSALRAVDGV